MRWRAFLVGVLSCCSSWLFAQDVETPAEFPGGIEGLLHYLQTNITYPESARQKGIEGTVFVSFEVTETGYIDQATVKILVSLDPACDAEALRIFSQVGEKWKPARRNGIPIRAGFIQPVRFALTEEYTQFRTVVVEKASKTAARNWNIYADAAMARVIGSVAPGDSVTVFTWKPWLYMIQSNSVAGFISSRAVYITPALSSMARELEMKSDSLITYQALADSLQRFEKLNYWSPVLKKDATSESWKDINDPSLHTKAYAFLRLSASDNDIKVGECSVVNLSFYVKEDNKIPLQFTTLAEQLDSIMHQSLSKEHCWVANAFIENVNSVEVKINGASFDEYRLYSAAYCPMNAEAITFRPVTIKVANVNRTTKEVEKLLPFTTKPVTINVRPVGTNTATETDFFRLTGNYVLTDTVSRRPGVPLQYSITLKGIGLTFPVQPPVLGSKDFTATFLSAEDADTILNDTYYSSKTFTWSLYLKEGTHAVWNRPVFSALDPVSGKTTVYSLNRIIPISATQSNAVVTSAIPKENFMLVDVSQSMQIEDYKPNRLGAVKKGVIDFLATRKPCDIGMIAFAGTAVVTDMSEPGVCYSAYNIGEIDYTQVGRGTAIGDALWLAIHTAAPSSKPRKLILIGDGEDISSRIHVLKAAALAKKNNMIIYTIGVGHSGMVPYGKDPQGNVLKVKSNFTDRTFRQLAARTGGRYFFAENAQDVTRFLKDILGQ